MGKKIIDTVHERVVGCLNIAHSLCVAAIRADVHKWPLEAFIQATSDLTINEQTGLLFRRVADTNEDVGLNRFHKSSWHEAVNEYCRAVRSAILIPGDMCSLCVRGDGTADVTALAKWWPTIGKEIAELGQPKFDRLQELLAQEHARALVVAGSRTPQGELTGLNTELASAEKPHSSRVPSDWWQKPVCGTKRQIAKWVGTTEPTLNNNDGKNWLLESWGIADPDPELDWPQPFAIFFPSEPRFTAVNSKRRTDADEWIKAKKSKIKQSEDKKTKRVRQNSRHQ